MQVAFRRLTWDSLWSRMGSARSSLLSQNYLIYLNRCCISRTYYLGAFSLPCCTNPPSLLDLLILFRMPVTKKTGAVCNIQSKGEGAAFVVFFGHQLTRCRPKCSSGFGTILYVISARSGESGQHKEG